jgi:hypothetical protein
MLRLASFTQSATEAIMNTTASTLHSTTVRTALGTGTITNYAIRLADGSVKWFTKRELDFITG